MPPLATGHQLCQPVKLVSVGSSWTKSNRTANCKCGLLSQLQNSNSSGNWLKEFAPLWLGADKIFTHFGRYALNPRTHSQSTRCVFHGLDQNVLVRNNLEGHSQLRWMESRLILSACQIGIQIEILSIWTWFRDVHAHIEYRVFANISSLYNANGGKLVFQRQSPSFVNFRIINMLYWGKTLINFSLVCCWFACGQGKFGPKSPNWSHKWNENTFCHFD